MQTLEFPVVAVGASAGGLEAATTMLSEAKMGDGIAYLLVMHLQPDRESLLVDLLSRKTPLPVAHMEDGGEVRPDHIYVIPPAFTASIAHSKFKLDPFPEPRGVRRPIDDMFKSLAEENGEKSAFVILSGTGTDGSYGIGQAKSAGGLTIVQEPSAAQYDGMPVAAMIEGNVDQVLPAQDIVAAITEYFKGHEALDWSGGKIAEPNHAPLKTIIQRLYQRFNVDFRSYKSGTLMRRLIKRLQIRKLAPNEYLEFFEAHPEEQVALLNDFYVNVTSCFRDPESFDALVEQALEPIIAKKSANDDLRIWVPGCSSGQEAYSIACCVAYLIEQHAKPLYVQIFATDIFAKVVETGRQLTFSEAEYLKIPQKYRDRYTRQVGYDRYEFTNALRQNIRFSQHDFLMMPAFSNMDLVSCRNVLIYLNEKAQMEAFKTFHFSLNQNGYLFLGNSETANRADDLFSVVDSEHRIYQSYGPRGRMPIIGQPWAEMRRKTEDIESPDVATGPQTRVSGIDSVISKYAPPFIIVTQSGRIRDTHGELGLVLETNTTANRTIYNSVRSSLRDTVVALLEDTAQSQKSGALVDQEAITPFGKAKFDIICEPLADGEYGILFIQTDRLQSFTEKYAIAQPTVDERLARLNAELERERDRRRAVAEEADTANEELKSSNEEMLSMNEELQSANEELTTANQELKEKIDQLTSAHAEIANFVSSSPVGIVMVDKELRIRRTTDYARDFIGVRSSDYGRLISELRMDFAPEGFLDMVKSVVDTGKPETVTGQSAVLGIYYDIAITPYVETTGEGSGATITIRDVTEGTVLRKKLESEILRRRLAMETAKMGFAELNPETQQVSVDSTLAAQFGLAGKGEYPVGHAFQFMPDVDKAIAFNKLEAAITDGTEYEFDFRIEHPEQGTKWFRTRGSRVETPNNGIRVIGPTIDITDIVRTSREGMFVGEMSHRIKNLFGVITSLIGMSANSTSDVEELVDGLDSQVTALANAYDMARKNVSFDQIEVEALLRELLLPFDPDRRAVLSGPEQTISADTLNAFTLVVHELATNAFKYGGLSTPDGSLTIEWQKTRQDMLQVKWQEAREGLDYNDDAPGFGTSLLDGAAQMGGGSIVREAAPGTLDITFELRVK
ncbi:CheR family methyltransferase [Shimia ponticola]|uniref:CheR family methyltransferase n=1 Tax=Shimia ponticola TaxID=2582893 RepID=UPI0011BE9D2D|nr:CheR family methyltransferase [Shimia ponticola]